LNRTSRERRFLPDHSGRIVRCRPASNVDRALPSVLLRLEASAERTTLLPFASKTNAWLCPLGVGRMYITYDVRVLSYVQQKRIYVDDSNRYSFSPTISLRKRNHEIPVSNC
jgi:hypothetical protein